MSEDRRDKRFRFSAEVEQQIRERYVAGASIRRLAQEHSCLPQTITAIILRNGVTTIRAGRPRTFDTDAEQAMRTDYEAGFTQSEIAEKFGCTQPLVSAVLRRQGVPIRRRSQAAPIAMRCADCDSDNVLPRPIPGLPQDTD